MAPPTMSASQQRTSPRLDSGSSPAVTFYSSVRRCCRPSSFLRPVATVINLFLVRLEVLHAETFVTRLISGFSTPNGGVLT